MYKFNVCGVSSPGGVYASMEVCTTSERLLDGIGTATFLSTCRANTACTASVWTSEGERFIHKKAEELEFTGDVTAVNDGSRPPIY